MDCIMVNVMLWLGIRIPTVFNPPVTSSGTVSFLEGLRLGVLARNVVRFALPDS